MSIKNRGNAEMVSVKTSDFAKLTWPDLEKWAGQKIVSRGKSYKRSVEGLCLTPDGGVLAWVQGSETYATQVWMDHATGLQSACSCPYDWGPCKHAVALILVYLDAFKNKTHLESVNAQDRRLKLLNAVADDESLNDDDEDDDEDDVDLEDKQDHEDDAVDEEPIPRKSRAPAKGIKRRSASERGTSRADQILRDHFSSMSKEDLIDFAINQAQQHGDIGREIVERAQLKGGKIAKLVQALACRARGRDELSRTRPSP